RQHVLPLLERANLTPDVVLATAHPGHAGAFVTTHLEAHAGPFTVILAAGDGTLHEIIEALVNTAPKGQRAAAPPAKLNFALIPSGTANALYASLFPRAPTDDDTAYKLRSVQALVDGRPSAPLTLALTTLQSPPNKRAPPRVAVSAVVASTALHAAILADSEALRAELPGLERFQRAAAQNLARWYHASVKLFPTAAAGVVEVYDPAAKAFVPHAQSTEDDPIVDLAGPFAYFVSVVNVDRLEPQFRIAPLWRDAKPEGAALDVVVLRPERDPSVQMDSEETREAFSEKVKGVMGGAYQDGAHVGLTYTDDGCVLESGEGWPVVEYFRCAGWEWEPDDIDDRAHLVCADGDIHEIVKGGKATCTAATPSDDKSGFGVYV
ncbi:ATP-NAD kinase-like domain-containing protein, partial [Fomitopsis serialis]|uniref:ATP-NAD kinase-like domain-containing protein n=1 Tax=Fomitopsis serialis TaxID=139415 RepID=UPI002008D49F